MIEAAAAQALAGHLAATAELWRPAPFHDDPAWVGQAPAIAGALLALGDDDVDTLESDPDALNDWCAARVPGIAVLLAAASACLATVPPPLPLVIPETQGRDVPGRKWAQLLHFAAACDMPGDALQKPAADHVVEWCSGKAHLGRLLARHRGVAVTAIERDAGLCEAGAALARRDRLPVSFRCADALAISADAAALTPAAHAVALHACGDLHLALLRLGSEAGVAALDIAPCCYHLTREHLWQPLSAALSGCALVSLALRREDLRLAVQETVTSSPRVIRQQQALAGWRLGFDSLQRELRGEDTYLPTPSRPARVLADGFPSFCADMCRHHDLDLPADADLERHLTRGQARLARVRRLELLRHACRRSLETLLVADRALFLGERGYSVLVRSFCNRPITPRNLLIQARRTPSVRVPA